ncbi:MAG: glycosyltransferase [Acidobacteriota bacterium]
MRICAVIKYPPIQGGVSAQGYWMARSLAARGHEVDVVTNGFEVEDTYRLRLTDDDMPWLTPSFDEPGESGGRVRLHTPEPISPKLTHIPQANPFVSKLAGLATQVVREHESDLLFAYYLEPNGVAAHLAASWTGRPYVVQHAGSDLGRLMKLPGLDTTYTEVFRRAGGICTGSPYTFMGLGVTPEQLYRHPPFYLPRDIFNPHDPALDLDAHIEAVRAREPEAVIAPGALDPDAPTIGIYGKLGEVKGSFDLLEALARLYREGRRFNFVAITSGLDSARYRRRVEELGLSEVTWILPFMAHWRIAGFLRACTAVCFLERDFPIKFHGPGIPREVLSCGTCLILSGEILAKQVMRHHMVDGENYLLVDDPKDHDALAAALRRVVDDPDEARAIGTRGYELQRETPDNEAQAEVYEQFFDDILARHAGRPSTLPPEERGLAADRTDTLRRLAHPLLEALGDDAAAALEAHVETEPEADSPHEDARSLCHAVSGTSSDPRVREAARYVEHMLWLGSFEVGGDARRRFDRDDLLPERSGGRWNPEVVRELAPLATRWLRIDTFHHLDLDGNTGSDGSAQRVVFHKLPSLTGHHFGVNAATAVVLEACDGRRSVAELLHHFADGRDPREVGAALGAMLRRFYREGLIVFVDPTEQPEAALHEPATAH